MSTHTFTLMATGNRSPDLHSAHLPETVCLAPRMLCSSIAASQFLLATQFLLPPSQDQLPTHLQTMELSHQLQPILLALPHLYTAPVTSQTDHTTAQAAIDGTESTLTDQEWTLAAMDREGEQYLFTTPRLLRHRLKHLQCHEPPHLHPALPTLRLSLWMHPLEDLLLDDQ